MTKNGHKIERMFQDKKDATRLIFDPLHLGRYFSILSTISGAEHQI